MPTSCARRSAPSQPVATCPPHSSPPPMRSSACWHELRCSSGFIMQNHRAGRRSASSAARAHRPDVRGATLSNCAVQLIGWGRRRTLRARGEPAPFATSIAARPGTGPCLLLLRPRLLVLPLAPLPLLRAAVLRSLHLLLCSLLLRRLLSCCLLRPLRQRPALGRASNAQRRLCRTDGFERVSSRWFCSTCSSKVRCSRHASSGVANSPRKTALPPRFTWALYGYLFPVFSL